MMVEQAPYSYIADYYDSVQKKNAAFPSVAKFWLDGFRHVSGKRVLNLGCGPTFYDNAMHFGSLPETYVGVDLNENSFSFLREDSHPKLVEAREFVNSRIINVELVAADVFGYLSKIEEPFDTIMGIGFFGTFDRPLLADLLKLCRNALEEDGTLLKMTWHGAMRTKEEEADKLRYRYDNEQEPEAQELIDFFQKNGFGALENDVLNCPPNTVGWRQIQVAHFQKSGAF